MNRGEQILVAIFDAIALPKKQKKYLWRKLLFDVRDYHKLFLRLASQILRGKNQEIATELLLFFRFYLKESKIGKMTEQFLSFYERLVIQLKELDKNNPLYELYLQTIYDMLHSPELYRYLLENLFSQSWEEIACGVISVNLSILEYYLETEKMQVNKVTSTQKDLNIFRWEKFEKCLLAKFFKQIQEQKFTENEFIMLKIFVHEFQLEQSSTLNQINKSKINGAYLELIKYLPRLFPIIYSMQEACEDLGQFLTAGLRHELFDQISQNEQIMGLAIQVTQQFGLTSIKINEFWESFLKIITPFSDHCSKYLLPLEKIFFQQILSAEQSEDLSKIGRGLKIVDNFLASNKKKMVSSLPYVLKKDFRVNPQTSTLAIISLQALFVLNQKNKMMKLNTDINEKMKNFVCELNNILKNQDLYFYGSQLVDKLASELLGLKILLKEKYWIIEEFMDGTESFYFTLIKFLFFLLENSPIQTEINALISLVIKKSKENEKQARLKLQMNTLHDCLQIFNSPRYLNNKETFILGLEALDGIANFCTPQAKVQYFQTLCRFPKHIPFSNLLQLKKSIRKRLLADQFCFLQTKHNQIIGSLYELIVIDKKIYYLECFLEAIQIFKNNQSVMQILKSHCSIISEIIATTSGEIKYELKLLEIILLHNKIANESYEKAIIQLKQQIFSMEINEDELGRVISIIREESAQEKSHTMFLKLNFLQCLSNIFTHLQSDQNNKLANKFLCQSSQTLFSVIKDLNQEYKYSFENMSVLHRIHTSIKNCLLKNDLKKNVNEKDRFQTRSLWGYILNKIGQILSLNKSNLSFHGNEQYYDFELSKLGYLDKKERKKFSVAYGLFIQSNLERISKMEYFRT